MIRQAGVAALEVWSKSMINPRVFAILALLTSATFTFAAAPDPSGMISRRALDRFSRILDLDKDQTESANALYEGYAVAYRSAVREYTAETRRIREADAPKSPELAEHTAAALKARNDRHAALEQALFSDLRALLSGKQAERWSAVERARRRDRLLPGVVSGENVDLVDLLETLGLPPAEASPLAATLASYELDLDRALLDKERVLNDERPFDALQEFNAASLVNRTSKTRDSGLVIRGINDRYAQQLEGALPESRRGAFRAALGSSGFPSAYATSAGSRLIADTLKLADLDASQREALDSIRKTYERDLAAANSRHEIAIREVETAKSSVVVPLESGGSYQVMLGKMEVNPVMTAMKEKRDLDTRLRDRIEKLLRPTQIDSLPEGKDATDEQIFLDDTAVMIRRGG